MHSQVLRILADILQIEDQGEGLADIERANCAAWDSLKHLQIAFALEDRFHTEFSESEMVQMKSSRSIVKLLTRKLGR